MKVKLIKTVDGYELFTQGFLKGSTNHGLIESLNIEEGPIRYKLSLKNCQAIERGYDLDELIKKEIADGKLHPNDGAKKEGIMRGFQKALELMCDKIFTLDDMHTVFIMGREGMEDKMNRYVTRIHEPTEWDVEIVMQPYHDGDFIGDGKTHVFEAKWKPTLDSDGCLILKRI